MNTFFGKPWQHWVAEYQKSHQNPINQYCHMIGIPLIAVSIVMLLATVVFHSIWPLAVGLFVLGWALQFIGHIVERKPPEFLQDWRFLFVGLRWWYQKFIRRQF